VIPPNRILIESDCFVNDDKEREQAKERLVGIVEKLMSAAPPSEEVKATFSVEKLLENFKNAMKVE
jgi:hypothetical protein